MNNVYIGRAALQAVYLEMWRRDEISDKQLLFLTASLWADQTALWLLGGGIRYVGASAILAPTGGSLTAAVAIPVVAGGVISYAIAGPEGVMDYADFLEDVVTLDAESIGEKMDVVFDRLREGHDPLEAFRPKAYGPIADPGDMRRLMSNILNYGAISILR